MSGKIFLSYRREDEPGFALALFGRLEQSFAPERLFMDVEGGIAAGQDFVRVLEDQVSACDVMLVVIGSKWLTATDEILRGRQYRHSHSASNAPPAVCTKNPTRYWHGP